MIPLDMPLTAFDTETTGPIPTECRMVTASIVMIEGASTGTSEWLVDPGIEIPEGATKVHGISTEHAREHGGDYAAGIAAVRAALEKEWAAGRLIVVMNAPFDYTLLDRESRRLGMAPFVPGPTFDPLVVDKHLYPYRKGSRTLTALCEAYSVQQTDAHQSTGDCLAAARVAYKQLRHPDMRSVDDVTVLQQLQTAWRAAAQDSLRAFWQGRGDERWRDVNSDWPIQLDNSEVTE